MSGKIVQITNDHRRTTEFLNQVVRGPRERDRFADPVRVGLETPNGGSTTVTELGLGFRMTTADLHGSRGEKVIVEDLDRIGAGVELLDARLIRLARPDGHDADSYDPA
jgi:hypothetical protein